VKEFKGPNGTAYVYQGKGHDWQLDFYPKYSRKHPRKEVRRTFGKSAKQAAIIVAKQMVGIFSNP
jgi:hypothetical protein